MTKMTGISRLNPTRQQGFMSLLSSAACEWFLIFMLLVAAAFSYLLTKFALYCKLQVPCPLCSRIDHVFEKNKPGYLQSLFCSNHKDEISSLLYCHNHGRLSDIRAMCEDCIMSFARSKKPTSESYRLLVSKLGVDIQNSGLKSPLSSKSSLPDYSGRCTCSCCNRILRTKSTQRLIHVNKVGYGASRANVKPPLPRVPGRSRFSRRENLKKIMDKFSGPMTPRTAGGTSFDPLSHVGYTELKVTSDSESEVQLSDEEDMTIAFCGKNYCNLEFHQGSQKLPRVSNDESDPPKEIHKTSEPMPSLIDQPVQLESIEQNGVNASALGGLLQQGLEEINWLHTNPKPMPSELPELISLDDAPQSVETVKSNAFLAPPSNLAVLSELISLTNILPPPSVVKVSGKSPEIIGTSNFRNISISEQTTVTGFPNDGSPSVPNNLNSDDPLALCNTARTVSSILAETFTTSNSGKLEEDIKSSTWSSSPGINKSSRDTNPEIHDHHDAIPGSDTCSDTIDIMQMEAALGRHDSGHESLDGITVKEIDGETVVDKLKRQVEYDHRCMKALFKELEEERSAAAVAANQTMAMITRLQEEKASLHMEALQYLRMMEEQAEYDMEALEKANDILSEKEKEIQDLEEQFEIYRNKFLDSPVIEYPHKRTSDTKGYKETYQDPHIESSPSITDLSDHTKISKSICTTEGGRIASNLEDEKLYISQCLKKLELKLHEISKKKALTDLSNGGHFAKVSSEGDNQEDLCDQGTQTGHKKGEFGLALPRDLTLRNGSLEKEKSADSVEENHFVCEESDCPDFHQHRLSSHVGELTLETFRSEIADLQDRLKALEADGDMLNHAFNTLRNGNDGLEFIQEIAYQLQELRKIEFKKRCLSIT